MKYAIGAVSDDDRRMILIAKKLEIIQNIEISCYGSILYWTEDRK